MVFITTTNVSSVCCFAVLEVHVSTEKFGAKVTYKTIYRKKFCDCLGFDSGISVARIFDWGALKPQITYNDVIKHFEKGTFCGSKDIVEWEIRSRSLVLTHN